MKLTGCLVKWNSPIICISNYINGDKFEDLKKECIIIEFNSIDNHNLDLLIKQICISESLKITDMAKQLLISNSQGDYRRCINLLQTYSQHTQDLFITEDIVRLYDNIILNRSVESDYYQTTKKIFLSNDCNDILQMYNHDKNFMPMMIHENYPSFIKEHKATNKQLLESCYETISNICDADVIEKTMYNIQNWNLQTIHGITSCCIPNYYCNAYNFKRDRGLIQITWAKVFSKYSLYKSNIKNIYSIYGIFYTNNYYTINDIHTLSTYILYNILSTDEINIKFGFELLNYYNLTINHLEKLIKMNKLSDKFKIYKPNTKKKLTEMYNTIYHYYQQHEINETIYNGTKKLEIETEIDEE